MLRNAEVGCIHLPEMNVVSRLQQRIQKIEDEPAIIIGDESFNVLEHKRTWTM
ncbi:MAG: hypothetical protein M3O30_12685 [Planctomycetota bacterium]|nr:hypothetical protein [Planctomycetota bacterium]